MSLLLRRLRGMLSIGVTWGVLWAVFFSVLGVVMGLFRPQDLDPGEGPIQIGTVLGAVGLVSGLAFGALLSLVERGRAIRDIAVGRAAMWGILASAVFPLLTGREDQVFLCGPVGATVAVTMLAIARKADRHDPTQPQDLRGVLFAYVRESVRDTVGSPAASRT